MAQIKATIDRLEEDKVVLVLDNKEQIVLHKNNFDFTLKEGDVIYINLSQSQSETKDQENLAKNIINEILTKKDDTV